MHFLFVPFELRNFPPPRSTEDGTFTCQNSTALASAGSSYSSSIFPRVLTYSQPTACILLPWQGSSSPSSADLAMASHQLQMAWLQPVGSRRNTHPPLIRGPTNIAQSYTHLPSATPAPCGARIPYCTPSSGSASAASTSPEGIRPYCSMFRLTVAFRVVSIRKLGGLTFLSLQ